MYKTSVTISTKSPHLFILFHSQSFPEVADVVDTLQFLNASRKHHHEKRHQQVRVTPQREVRFTAKLLEEIQVTMTVRQTSIHQMTICQYNCVSGNRKLRFQPIRDNLSYTREQHYTRLLDDCSHSHWNLSRSCYTVLLTIGTKTWILTRFPLALTKSIPLETSLSADNPLFYLQFRLSTWPVL